MKKIMSMIMAAMVFLTIGTGYVQAQDKTSDSASELPKVYLIKEITPENLVKIYEALGRKAEGKVAVKLSTGEPGGHNFLQPTLIAPLVRKMNGTMVADVPIRRHTSRLLPTTVLRRLRKWTSWMPTAKCPCR